MFPTSTWIRVVECQNQSMDAPVYRCTDAPRPDSHRRRFSCHVSGARRAHVTPFESIFPPRVFEAIPSLESRFYSRTYVMSDDRVNIILHPVLSCSSSHPPRRARTIIEFMLCVSTLSTRSSGSISSDR